MKSKISLAFLLSLTLSVSAAPLEQSIQVKFNNGVKTTEEAVISYHLSNAGLYLCDRSGFVGHCVHYATPFGQCVDQFPHGKGVKSASSDQGSRCTLYSSTTLGIRICATKTGVIGLAATVADLLSDRLLAVGKSRQEQARAGEAYHSMIELGSQS
ncbi:predicted protein [Histoplasma mississippiense (nom. inval.)]|uniref:predicted protein n=1 Tax=Ajellomyces capsulatus (strain NAm1 / WU24) TaxID=2059318 RepID=UPI000157B971|nr:predicted protein [Histoplasma mississippiense (nom. inval.)]EDN04011.1 predicted protein [Histoplasma mississippiense (nom. inval.)]